MLRWVRRPQDAALLRGSAKGDTASGTVATADAKVATNAELRRIPAPLQSQCFLMSAMPVWSLDVVAAQGIVDDDLMLRENINRRQMGSEMNKTELCLQFSNDQ